MLLTVSPTASGCVQRVLLGLAATEILNERAEHGHDEGDDQQADANA